MQTLDWTMEYKTRVANVLTPHLCDLGEGPVWDSANRRLLWVDILKGVIHQYFTDEKRHQLFETGQMTGAIALMHSGEIMAALQNGFYRINLETGDMHPISDPEATSPDNRFNDGKCDPAGRFWAGTMSVFDTKNAGNLYAVDLDFSVSLKIEGVSCSNGLAWSADHQTFYYIDTGAQSVVAYNYDVSNGSISQKRTIIEIPPDEGYPDGMTIDNEGMLWIALWNGWKVKRYNPNDGQLLDEVLLPVSQVTSCTFGGENLGDLYITSARSGLSDADLEIQPLAGSIFVIKNIGYKGIETFKFG